MDDRKKIPIRSGVGTGAASQKQKQQPTQINGVSNNNNNISNNNKKKRKNKRRRNPQRKSGGASSSATHRGPPLTPSVKITIRNIRDVDVAQTIRTLIFKANEKNHSTTPSNSLEPILVLDEKTLEKLVNDENMAVAAMTKWQKEIESKGKNESNAIDVDETAVIKSEEDESKQTLPDPVDPLVVEMEKSMCITEQINGGSNSHKDQIVEVRVLYMIPPRKTRRRGDKPGIAYLLLTAPPIETKTTSITELHPITEEDNNVETMDDNEPPKTQPVPITVPTTTVVHGAPVIVDYSRDVAQRRLLLDNALELLQTTAKASQSSSSSSSATDTSMMMMVVETSMNEKIWKQQAYSSNSPVDRMAGSIFQTEDYEQFIVNNQRTEEERKARPKPPPGGGGVINAPALASSSSSLTTTTSVTTTNLLTSHGTSTTATTGNGAPVAALVLHLQKKQEEENMRKLAKRKENDTKKSNSKKSVVKPKAILSTGASNSKRSNSNSNNRSSAAATGTQPSSSSSTATTTNANKSQKRNNPRRVRKPKDSNKPTDSTSNNNKNSINRGGGG